jgi:hypothetical protein
LEGEMLTILKDSLPLSLLMSKIDSYNADGIGLVNVNYYLDSAKASVLRLRGKSSSRELTEQFVLALQKEPYFSDIISPLSNLVGKGERFINMDMNVESGVIIADYEKVQAKSEAGAEKGDEGMMPAAEAMSDPGATLGEGVVAFPIEGVAPSAAETAPSEVGKVVPPANSVIAPKK